MFTLAIWVWEGGGKTIYCKAGMLNNAGKGVFDKMKH